MCDMTTFTMGMQGAGMAASAVGAYAKASAQSAALSGQAATADINARLAETQAQQATAAGQRRLQSLQLSTAALKGKQRASLAANGVDIGVGSALNVLDSTDVMGAEDEAAVKLEALQKAWGYRIQGTSYTNDALMKRTAADAISPGFEALTSLVTDAGKVAPSWYKMLDKPEGDYNRLGRLERNR